MRDRFLACCNLYHCVLCCDYHKLVMAKACSEVSKACSAPEQHMDRVDDRKYATNKSRIQQPWRVLKQYVYKARLCGPWGAVARSASGYCSAVAV